METSKTMMYFGSLIQRMGGTPSPTKYRETRVKAETGVEGFCGDDWDKQETGSLESEHGPLPDQS
jgi:hypothetical protein